MVEKKKTPVKKSGVIRVRAAGILLNSKNEALLVNHQKKGKSYWLFPGGGVEYGEKIFSALKREFKEEVSAGINKIHNMCFAHETIYPGRERHIINFYFRVSVKKPFKPRVKEEKVLKGAEWINVRKFRKILFYPGAKNVIINLWKNEFKDNKGFIDVKWKK